MNAHAAVAPSNGATFLDAPPPGRDRFEYLEVGADMALVRLAVPGPLVDGKPSTVILNVETGGPDVGLPPLPSPDGDGVVTREIDGAMQAGFSVPLDLIRDPDAKFAVSVDEHPPCELPSPTMREPGPRVRRGTESEAMAEVRRELAEANARAEREHERVCLLQDVLAEARQLEAAARDEATGASRFLEQVRDERDAARNQLEALTADARDAAERGQERQGALEARVQELVKAAEVARTEVQARDQQLERRVPSTRNAGAGAG